MFYIAYLIITYSYIIFILGMVGLLYKSVVISVSLIFFIVTAYLKRQEIKKGLLQCKWSEISKGTSPLSCVLLILLISQAVINLIGVLGPELAFDALWYHLTIPKIFLMDHSVHHLSGGLFYYSDMPKLIDMLYVASLSFGTEILAKTIHFLFGIACLFALYRLSRKFLSVQLSLMACIVFYANLVVGWESITSYIDLGRTFFEILALLGFVEYFESKNKRWLFNSALMLGGAISSKLLAILGIPLFIILLLIIYREEHKLKFFIKNSALYTLYALLVPLPYFIFSLVNTGNPIYPFFTKYYPVTRNMQQLLNPIHFILSFWNIFIHAADPISPVYIISSPLLFLLLKRFNFEEKIIVVYSLLGYICWYITPDTGGGRFVLPFLPAFSLLVMILYSYVKDTKMKTVMLLLCIFISIISIGYRGFANKRYVPVIVGTETKHDFLTKNLNFSFGDFYDTDNYFYGTMTNKDMVLLYGFHNEYYVNFPFIDSSYVKEGDEFNYIATQNSNLPKRFSAWNLVYVNPKTHVKLYSIGGQKWVY